MAGTKQWMVTFTSQVFGDGMDPVEEAFIAAPGTPHEEVQRWVADLFMLLDGDEYEVNEDATEYMSGMRVVKVEWEHPAYTVTAELKTFHPVLIPEVAGR
jgi:hypothetical protein